MLEILICLIFLAIAAVIDIQKGEFSNKFLALMSIIGIASVLLFYNSSSWLIIYGIAAVVFFLGFLMYIFGQMGGGDAFVFAFVSLMVPFYPKSIIPYLNQLGIHPAVSIYPFIVSVFLLSGILFMIWMPLTYLRKIAKIQSDIEEYKKKQKLAFLYMLILVPVTILWLLTMPFFVVLIIPIALSLAMMPFKSDIVKHFFAKAKKVSDINSDDVLALDMINSSIRKKLGLTRKTLMPREIKVLQEKARASNIKTLIVCENLPKFVPFILLSFIISILFGDIFLSLALSA